MDLLQRILECSDEEVKDIIDKELERLNKEATFVERLGFLQLSKSVSTFKGFIPFKTRIKYANMNIEDYSMDTTDFFYEFAHFVRKYKVDSKASLIYSLESFINAYFGYPGKADREDVFNTIAWQTTNSDEEYFEALENNKIGDLKGKGAAECTERAALAQQVLSLFGTESYYCMGCVALKDKQEGHCFNIVKRKNDYALLDYSIPVVSYKQDGGFWKYFPFVGELTNEEFLNFINNGVIKTFDDYSLERFKKRELTGERKYVVGEYELEQGFGTK